MGIAEKLRAKQHEAAEQTSTKQNPLEWTPKEGSHRIRLLPPRDFKSKDPRSVDEDFVTFYTTHAYHFVSDSYEDLVNGTNKGRYVWTRREYVVDGIKKKDPIDDLVGEMYDAYRKNKDNQLRNMAGSLKRKRHFFCPILLLDEPDPEKRFRILVDKTSKGKIFSWLCREMGFPFYKDTQDIWVDEDSKKWSPDKEYKDLLDLNEGHDVELVYTKTGSQPWDFNYDNSFVVKKPRPLTEEELTLIEQRPNLNDWVEYEEDYDALKKMADKLLGDDEDYDDDEEVEASKPSKVSGQSTASKIKKPVDTGLPKINKAEVEQEALDDEAMDDILAEIDDED